MYSFKISLNTVLKKEFFRMFIMDESIRVEHNDEMLALALSFELVLSIN